ncbi:MAG: ASCH domain-containing protein [Tissierellia bacterium]|nr:ASCH domain-containing protein [Tissierellia bacterium]
MEDKIKAYWKKFCEEKQLPETTEYSAWEFGNTKEMADELAELVKAGIKTATTSAYELYDNDGEDLPQVGEYNIILDGSDEPVCITRTISVEKIPYHLITPEYAWLEGEGDRSYAYWKKVHDEFFEYEFKLVGKEFYEEAPMICEVFEKVY